MADKPTVAILKGIPASGKTTWAEKTAAAAPEKIVHVSRDALRRELPSERAVLAARDAAINKALDEGKDVIIDETSLDPRTESHLRNLIGDRAVVTTVIFDIPLATAFEREFKRRQDPSHLPVPKEAIASAYSKFLAWMHAGRMYDPKGKEGEGNK